MSKVFNFHLGISELTDPITRTDVGYVYTKDVSTRTELFYYDALGNAVQITDNGSLNTSASTPTQIVNGTSSVSIPIANQSVIVTTNGTQRLEIDSSGNLDADLTVCTIGSSSYSFENASGDPLISINSSSAINLTSWGAGSTVSFDTEDGSLIFSTMGTQRVEINKDGDFDGDFETCTLDSSNSLTVTSASLLNISSTYAPGSNTDVINITTGSDDANIKIETSGVDADIIIQTTDSGDVDIYSDYTKVRGRLIIISSVANFGSPDDAIALQTTGTNANISISSSNKDVSIVAGEDCNITSTLDTNIASSQYVNISSSDAPASNTDVINITTSSDDANIKIETSGVSSDIIIQTTDSGDVDILGEFISLTANASQGIPSVNAISLLATGNNANIDISSSNYDVNISAGNDLDVLVNRLIQLNSSYAPVSNTEVINITTSNDDANIRMRSTGSSSDIKLETIGGSANIELTTTGADGFILLTTDDAYMTFTTGGQPITLDSGNSIILEADLYVNINSSDAPASNTDVINITTSSDDANIKLETSGADAEIRVLAQDLVYITSGVADDTAGITLYANGYSGASTKQGGNIYINSRSGIVQLLTTKAFDSGSNTGLELQTNGEYSDLLINTLALESDIFITSYRDTTLKVSRYFYIQDTSSNNIVAFNDSSDDFIIKTYSSGDLNLETTNGDITIEAGTDGDVSIIASGDTTGAILIDAGQELTLDGKYGIFLEVDGSRIITVNSGNIEFSEELLLESASPSIFERTSTATTGALTSLQLRHTTTNNMVDTFGVSLLFQIEDSSGTANNSAYILGRRDTADNSGALAFGTYDTGSSGIRLYITHDGKLSTGGEISPDTSTGGLCLYQGAEDTSILTMKSSDVAHGITTMAETDTYCYMRKNNPSSGGIQLTGLSENEIAIYLRGMSTTVDSTETTSSYACINLSCNKKSGTGLTYFSSDENIVVWRNYSYTRMILKGDGELYNDYASTMTTYDKYDDLKLARNTQLALASNERSKLDSSVLKDLQELGIINKEGFGSMQQINAVTLGAITQLSNVVKIMASELGWSDKKLQLALKTY